MQKVLIITYYWPPAGGPGVQRWLKFVKYLPEFGIMPIVFIPENPNYPLVDESLVKEVPEGVQIIEQPIYEPYGLAALFSRRKTKRISSGIIQKYQKQSFLERAMLWVRGNLFIPDARKFWIKPSAKAVGGIVKKEGIQTVVTTGPPHSVHLIGLQLKQKLGVHWVADFRDPWTSIGYHNKLKLSNYAQQKHKKLERQVLNTADQIMVTSRTTENEFRQITSKPIAVITNGYDGERPQLPLDENFTISHTGSLLTDRNPMVLWNALGELVNENEAFAKHLKIRLVGVVGDGVIDSLKKHQLFKFAEVVGYVSHEEVWAYQVKSQLLLLLEIDAPETQGIIPGKLFEYLNSKRPILAIGPEQWEAGGFVAEHKAGKYVRATDKASLKKVLLDWFVQYENQKLIVDSVGVENYHRRELTKTLAKYLKWESS